MSGPPDYDTVPWGQLPMPRSLAVLVFVPSPNGTSHVIAFGPPDVDRYEQAGMNPAEALDEVLGQARARAEQLGGVVVSVPVLSDHR